MLHVTKFLLLGLSASLFLGCSIDPNYRPDFSFPTEYGDAEMGKEAFMDLGCNFCHSVEDVELSVHPLASSAFVHLELGAATAGAKRREELLTAIVDPHHYLAETYREKLILEGTAPLTSPMPRMEEMTLGQLYDLIAFLDSEYE